MNLKQALRLYVIPDREIGVPRTLLAQTRDALKGGATAIQLRDKELSGRKLLELATAMADLCHEMGALFIVNDRLDIALLSGADGVHLGQDDISHVIARTICPPNFIIGVSAQTCEQAKLAEQQGVDYLGVGAVTLTQTKGEAKALGLSGVQKVAAATPLPCVAIGGVNLDNALEVMQTGVSGISVISAIVGANDIVAATRQFSKIIG